MSGDALSELLTPDRVVILLDPVHRDATLDAAARLLAENSPTLTSVIADGLRQREKLGSTALGRGVAIPHCRSNAFGVARGAFLRLAYPIDFGAGDGEPVDLVFAMSVPQDAVELHLKSLSALAARFADAAFREALREAASIAALRDLLIADGPSRHAA